MAYDPALAKVVLFGGSDRSSFLVLSAGERVSVRSKPS
jgi:hypothetical protein